jgi:hypothetical protein
VNSALLISVFVAFAALPSLAETISFLGGSITLPPGVTHHPKQGIDTSVESFRSSDGMPEIHYDIGWQPGDFSSPPKDAIGITFSRAGTNGGKPYWATVVRRHDMCVVFPEKGSVAIFQTSIVKEADIEKVLALVLRLYPPIYK